MNTATVSGTPLTSVEPQTAQYAQTLRSILEDQLIGKNGNGQWYIALNGPQNIWRSAWAFDTLIDCLETLKMLDPSYEPPTVNGVSIIDLSLEQGLNPSSGNWWDDFGWMGVTCLRAAEIPGLDAKRQGLLLQKAANAWCYIYGNGWKTGTSPADWGHFDVPFPGEAWGKTGITGNIGAPNVFTHAMKHSNCEAYRPRFTPGGIWNADFKTELPQQSPVYGPTASYLSPLQNTVTNAIYTLLTLRLYRALRNPDYAAYFAGAAIDLETVKTAWENQLSWFHKWFFTPPPAQSLLQPTGTMKALVRERVSTYANNSWDAGFDKGLAWAGDQGLLCAVLRESAELLQEEPAQNDLLGNYAMIVEAVRENLYSDKGHTAPGTHLRPWTVFGANDAFPLFPQGNDDADYQTGVAVFYRYLLQLQTADPQLTATFRDPVFASANAVCAPSFPLPTDDSFQYVCDALVQQYTVDSADRVEFNKLTPWINRVALLVMAIRLARA